jgi:hypothetical protein
VRRKTEVIGGIKLGVRKGKMEKGENGKGEELRLNDAELTWRPKPSLFPSGAFHAPYSP